MKENALYMVYISGIVMVSSGFYVWLFQLFAEKVTFNMKSEYFKQALNKDAAFYDE